MSSSLSSAKSSSSSSSSRSRRSRLPRFTLADIQKATNDFDPTRIIARGAYGITYKGILEDGQTVAVKRLDKDDNLVEEFRNEIYILTNYPNDYLVSLIGKCEESQELIIVHEFMPNGTLADHLFSKKDEDTSLSWEQQLGICLDAARGLEFLHNHIANTKRIIHRNVKPASIWLDENMGGRISDFGCAKVGPANTTRSAVTVSTDARDTLGYLDPYYNMTGQLTRRTDTYAFGVVLLQVLCRRRAFDEGLDQDQQMLVPWAQTCFRNGTLHNIVDTRLKGQVSSDCLNEFADVAFSCLLYEPNDRPKMSQVVEKLESILNKSRRRSPLYSTTELIRVHGFPWSDPVSSSLTSLAVCILLFPFCCLVVPSVGLLIFRLTKAALEGRLKVRIFKPETQKTV